MTISCEESDGVEIIRLEGDVDLTNADLVRQAVDATTADCVVLDLSAVTFLDSMAVSMLDAAIGVWRRKTGHFLVVSPPETPSAWTLRVTGLGGNVCESLDDALVAAIERYAAEPAHPARLPVAKRGRARRRGRVSASARRPRAASAAWRALRASRSTALAARSSRPRRRAQSATARRALSTALRSTRGFESSAGKRVSVGDARDAPAIAPNPLASIGFASVPASSASGSLAAPARNVAETCCRSGSGACPSARRSDRATPSAGRAPRGTRAPPRLRPT